MRHLALAVPVLCVAALAAAARAQDIPAPPAPAALPARFVGWDDMRDPEFQFNPDERAVLGFSVHASPAARAALDAAESALAAGDARTAARRFADMIVTYGDEALQVQAGRGRWVGLGEWSLHELLTRVPESARAAVTSADDRANVSTAAAWRDLPRLRVLAGNLEGRDEGRRAAALLARLLAERGEGAAALAAAEHAGLPEPSASSASSVAAASAPLQLPETLDVTWRSELVVDAIGQRNPFASSTIFEAPIGPLAPLIADDVVYVTDSISVSALDALTGRRLWHHVGPLERIALEGSASRWFGFDIYVDNWRDRAVSPYQCLTPALAGRLVITTEQAPEEKRELHNFEGIPINWPLPRRRLIALERDTGAEVWRQERPELGPDAFVNTFDVAGPPAVGEGVIYAAGSITEGAINSYVAAFDQHTGELLWRTLLCSGQQDLTMFNRPFQEHTASPPLLHDGMLYLVSNLGLVASLDGFSGRLRWLAGYDTIARRASRSPERDQRREVNFVNRPPVFEGGRLIVGPLDGSRVLALDPQTGRVAWTLEAQWNSSRGGRHDLLGVGDGRLLVVSDGSVECFDAASGKLQWSSMLGLETDERLTGVGCLADRTLLLPAPSRLIALDIDAPEKPVTRIWQGAAAQRDVRRVVAGGPVLLLTDNRDILGVVDANGVLESALEAATASPTAQLRAAELLLAEGRIAEAGTRFEAVLASGDRALTARATSGRLQAAARAAREQGDVAAWQELLAVAGRLGDPWSAAEQALPALAALGADDAVDVALASLAAQDAERILDLGRLTPDGGQPVALLLAQRRLQHDAPAAAVARLQEALTRWPDARWNGVPVRQAAARRIAALIDENGAAVYEPFEQQAVAALAEDSRPEAVAAVEARFPNAHAVAAARSELLRVRLQDGEAREVFEELGAMSSAGADRDLVALRAEAAEALRESDFADALLGRPHEQPPAQLPSLPGADCTRSTFEVSELGTVIFPMLAGRLQPPYEQCVVGAINQQGKVFLLDTVTGRILWTKLLPDRISYLSSSTGVDFLTDGSRLFVQVPRKPSAQGGEPTDLLVAFSLENGAILWSSDLPGEARATVVASGLLLRLCGGTPSDSRRFRVDGYGTGSGARALSVDLPAAVDCRLYRAGPHVVVFSSGDVLRDGTSVDGRLSVLDVAHGALAGSVPLAGDGSSVVLALDDPPVLMLSRRAPDGSGALLSAWDPATQAVLWEAAVAATASSRQSLFPAGNGRLLLVAPVMGSEGRSATVQLLPIDALAGPLPATPGGAVLVPVKGQERGLVPLLVLADVSDNSRLLVADAATAQLLYQVNLPPPTGGTLRVAQARDGFVLLQEPLLRDQPSCTVRLFDADTGAERYSTVLSGLPAFGQSEVVLAEGALLLARGGNVTILRSQGP